MFENVATTRCSEFAVASDRWASLIGDAELVMHSHPGGEPCPSLHDMRQAAAIGLPWYVKPAGSDGFYFGHGVPAWHLIGRPYRFGVTDCYALIRDGLRMLYDVRIRDYPREWGFWERGDGMFERNLGAEGFRVVSDRASDALPSDVVLFKVRSKVANHAGLVIAGGRMLHHPTPGVPYEPSYLSRTVSLGRWARIPSLVVRHA